MFLFVATHALVHFLQMVICAWELLLARYGGSNGNGQVSSAAGSAMGASLFSSAARVSSSVQSTVPLTTTNPVSALFPVSFLLGLYLLVSAWLWNTISWRCSSLWHGWFCVSVMSCVTVLHTLVLGSAFLFLLYCLFICIDVILFGNDTHWERFLDVCKLGGWSMYWKGREIGVRRGWLRRGAAGMMMTEEMVGGNGEHSAVSVWGEGSLFNERGRFLSGGGGRARKRMR